MSDVALAFKLLDLLQGHPGYGANCSQCGEPIVDSLGSIMAVEWTVNSEGINHADSRDGRACQTYILRRLEEQRRSMDTLRRNQIIEQMLKEFT